MGNNIDFTKVAAASKTNAPAVIDKSKTLLPGKEKELVDALGKDLVTGKHAAIHDPFKIAAEEEGLAADGMQLADAGAAATDAASAGSGAAAPGAAGTEAAGAGTASSGAAGAGAAGAGAAGAGAGAAAISGGMVAVGVAAGVAVAAAVGGKAAAALVSAAAGGNPLAGRAIDGPLSGSNVYVDENADGIAQVSELVGTTGSDGRFSFTTTKVGNLIITGGTNTDTGLANHTTLKAVAGSAVITPITTLMQEYMVSKGISAAAAETAIEQALGISGLGVDLGSYDPLAHGSTDATALALQKVNVQLATAAEKFNSTSSGAGDAFIDAIVAKIADGTCDGAGEVDFNDAAFITSMADVVDNTYTDITAATVALAADIKSSADSVDNAVSLDPNGVGSIGAIQESALDNVVDVAVADVPGSGIYNLIDTAANLVGDSAACDGAVDITALDALSVSDASAIASCAQTGNFIYDLSDTASNLLGADPAIFDAANKNYALDITVTDIVDVSQATTISGFTLAGTLTYSLSDTATNLAAASAAIGNGATDITVIGTATVAEALPIIAFTNSGALTLDVSDSVAHLTGEVGNLSAATSVMAILDSGGANDDLTGVTLDNDITVIDLNGRSVTMTLAQTNGLITVDTAGGGSVSVGGAVSTDTDISGMTGLTFSGTVTVSPGVTLTLTAAQADGLTIDGGGTVEITLLEDCLTADLSSVTAATVNVALDASGYPTIEGNLGAATVTISGSGTVAINGSASFGSATFFIGTDATLAVETASVDTSGLTFTGTGNLLVDMGLGDETTVIANVIAGNQGDVLVSLINSNDWYMSLTDTDAAAVLADGRISFDPDTDVIVTGLGENLLALDPIHVGSWGGSSTTFDATDNAVAMTITQAGQFVDASVNFDSSDSLKITCTPSELEAFSNDYDYPSYLFSASVTLMLTAADVDGQAVYVPNENIEITGMDATTLYDFSGISTDFGTITAMVATGGILDAGTDLGWAPLVIADGETLTLTAAQANNMTITAGTGNIVITDMDATSYYDFTTIETVSGTITAMVTTGGILDAFTNLGGATLLIADGETLTLTAAQADGAPISGAGTVAITGDMSGKDFSSITADNLDITAATGEGAATLPNLDTGKTLTVTVAQADSASFSGAGTVAITGGDMTGKMFDLITANVDITAATATGPISAISLDPGTGLTLTMTAAQADGATTGGLGTVAVTALQSTVAADLHLITAATVTAAAALGDATTAFIGNLGRAAVAITDAPGNAVGIFNVDGATMGTATFTVDANSMLQGTAAKLGGVTVTGTGAVAVTALMAATDLSGLDATLTVYAALADAQNISANANLGTVDGYVLDAATTATMTAAQAAFITSAGGTQNITLSDQASALSLYAGVETFTLGDFANTVTMGSFVSVHGGTDNDTIQFTTDAQTLTDADLANVTSVEALVTADGINSITLGANANTSGLVSVTGGTGVDTIDLSDGAYTLNAIIDGGAGDDIITGGAGNDIIIGGAGADFMDLGVGAGSDTVRIADGDAFPTNVCDVVSHFEIANDTLDLDYTDVAANTGGGVDGINAGGISVLFKSHSINANGLMEFDDADTFAAAVVINLTNLEDAINYAIDNITDLGSTVLIKIDQDSSGDYGAGQVDGLMVYQRTPQVTMVYLENLDVSAAGWGLGTVAAANTVVIG